MVQIVEKRVIDRTIVRQRVRAIAYRVCIYALLCALAIVSIAFAVERARLASELNAAQEVASSAIEAHGFYRAKIVSQRALFKKIDSGLQPVVKDSGLHVAAVEKARAALKTKTVGKPIIPDVEGEPAKVSVSCLYIPWTDGRLYIKAYDNKTNVLTYSLDQRFKLVGTYLADEKGTIKFGKLKLYEIVQKSESTKDQQIIGKAEITDYELLAAKPPIAKWRPSFGVKAGVEVGLDEQIVGLNPLLTGVLAGVEVGFNRLSIFGFADIKEQPTLLVGAGWRW